MVRRFPRLATAHLVVTSPRAPDYNCLAFAVHDQTRRLSPVLWDPERQLYPWPEGAPREDTVVAWAAALSTFGFETCSSSAAGEAWEKIAILAKGETAVHVARQLPNGKWTSKIGKWEDIEHDLLALEGERYGEVTQIMRRAAPRTAADGEGKPVSGGGKGERPSKVRITKATRFPRWSG